MTCWKARPNLTRAAGLSVCLIALMGAGPGLHGVLSPAVAQEAASAVQDVTLQDVVLPLGGTVLTAPRLTVSGTRLSKDDVVALLKPGPGAPWPARLARLDAASLTIPELRVSYVEGGPARQGVVYRDVVAKDVRAGRIAELTASGASVSVTGGPRTGTGTYGRIEARDVDLVTLSRLYGEPGDGKGAMQRIYGVVSLSDVAYVDDRGTALRIARIEGRDMSGRQTPATWAGAFQSLTGLDLDREALDTMSPAERARLTGMAADLVDSVAIGALEATGLSLQETRDKAVDLSIARFTMGAAGASFEDIGFSGGGARSRIGRLSLSGFSLAPTVAALRRLSALTTPPSDDDLRRLTPTIGTLAVQNVAIDLPAETVPAEPPPAAARVPVDRVPVDRPPGLGGDLRAGPPAMPAPSPVPPSPVPAPVVLPAAHVGLRDATMSFGTPKDGVPTAGRLSLSGLTLPSAAVAGIPGLGSLGQYGYRDLDLDAVAESSWDEAARELKVREISVSGKEMGTLRLNGTVGGIGPEVFDADAAVSGYAWLSATAKALDLTIENTGLFERFITAQSKVLSLKPEELTQEYATASAFGVPAILGGSANAKAIGTAMAQFVAKPGRLFLSARPKNGTGLGVIDFSAAPNPGAVLDRLDVTAKAN
ncbi:hypothetical protein ASG40_16005 [Methylobacterium sp. Leaf399]|uniref:hypothetical protein n=1 Tax=unclassified Methylobacterium TaxID=2615210 RepID=UPI0006F655C4|nr:MULTISPECIES: hypothetical protein [unclassified Methylobacterium]KQP48955.1 hypothetical protein ASF39_14480 [Methylobacterium sp. Leaf108]KQT18840.1 hypothetical protein ASG40_16005 [Methylobacterium sp. Leaf399]